MLLVEIARSKEIPCPPSRKAVEDMFLSHNQQAIDTHRSRARTHPKLVCPEAAGDGDEGSAQTLKDGGQTLLQTVIVNSGSRA